MRLYNETCQCLEEQHDSVFSKRPVCVVTKSYIVWKIVQYMMCTVGQWICRVQKVHWCSFEFHIAGNPVRKLPLVKCWCSIKERHPQLSEYSSLSQLHICLSQNFPPIFQPKQCTVTGWMQMQIWDLVCLRLSRTLKKFAKMRSSSAFLTNSFCFRSYNYFLKNTCYMLMSLLLFLRGKGI